MVSFYGDYNLTETVNIPFNTFTSDDPSASCTVTDLAAGDIYVHKDGVVGAPGGITVSLNVGAVNGNHLAILDLSNTDDAGFYANGSRYQVRMEGVTIDGATINAWIGAFSIGCTLRPTTLGRTLDVQATGEVDANLTMIGGVVQSATDLKDFADTGYDPSTHRARANLEEILGHLLTQTGTQLADGFEKFFDVATPTGTVNSLPGAAPDAAGGLPVSDAGGLDLDTLLGYLTGGVATAAKLEAYVQLLARKDAAIATDRATELGEINADEGSGAGAFDNTTESQEALRDRGDSAWITATGFSTHSAANVKTAIEAVGSHLALIKTVTDAIPDSGALTTIVADIDQIKADLPSRITKNTALANFEFLMVDSTDHLSGKTGLTVTAQRSIDGAAFGNCANSVSEVGSGVYKINLAAADLNGTVITLLFTASGADARLITLITQP